jgi:outer membrane immunogenic protein
MRCFRLVAAAALFPAAVLSTPLRAADIGFPPPFSSVPDVQRSSYSWTGFYVGANLGGNITSNWNADSQPQSTFTFHDDNSGEVAPTLNAGTGGIAGGVQAGYNFQYGSYVAGGEVDFDGLQAGGSSAYQMFVPFQGYITTTAASEWLKYLSTVRGRLGYVLYDRWLVYVTGGLAFGGYQSSGAVTLNGQPAYVWSDSNSGVRTGYVLGGGVEWAITDNIALRLEGYYYNLGSTLNTAVGNAAVMANPALSNYRWVYKLTTAGDVARIGVDYKF